jgi:molybdopterin molybdotransferase
VGGVCDEQTPPMDKARLRLRDPLTENRARRILRVVLTPADAETQIAQHSPAFPVESLPLAQCAGAILRENIYAERDQPPFDRVSMDGIAVDSAAVSAGAKQLRVQATQMAGSPPLKLEASDACIEVMTGAVLPAGCDAVIQVEHLEVREGIATLNSKAAAAPGQNVHRRASDSRRGAQLLMSGIRLGAPEVAIAASAGLARLNVSTQPAIAVISTGDELVEPGEPILEHQIRRSNAYGIATALRRQGFSRVADDHIADDLDALHERLALHLGTHDVLILSGGVSMGKLDLVPRALADLGVRQVFHRVQQRPGKPMWFGVSARGALVFALPGNPVSTLVCLSRYVVPALFNAMGATAAPADVVALAEDFEVRVPLAVFLPVQIQVDAQARMCAVPRKTNGSGDFTSLAGTAGFIELPPGPGTQRRGYLSRLYRW